MISLIIVTLCFTLIGCGIDEKITITKLNDIKDTVNDNLTSYNENHNNEYKNFSSIYVDEKEMVVIVELEINTKEEQTWFKNNIYNSKDIKFIQGEPYTTLEYSFLITKNQDTDIKFNKYYETYDRMIYFASNVDEFYISDNNYETKETLKEYLTIYLQTFDDGIKSIANSLTVDDVIYDGGTTIYKSEDEDITMIVCNTLDGNKDVYVGDYKMGYEENMCK